MMDLKTLFNEYGWLANAIAIIGLPASIAFSIWKWILPRIQGTKFESIIPKSFEINWNFSNAKRIAKIAIVDDEPKDFPVNELRSDAFSITVYKQINLADTSELAEYDIVFLDMKGIVKDDPEYGGLKLIAELRKINPKQKICAVSSKTFDPTATEFFKQADNYKKKPMTSQECKKVIESFINSLFQPFLAVAEAKKAIKKFPRPIKVKIISEMKQSLEAKETAQSLDCQSAPKTFHLSASKTFQSSDLSWHHFYGV